MTTTATLATMGWGIMNHFLFSPNDFHFFGAMRMYTGGQKFQTDDEIKRGALN
jgi:hypothetical protein